MSATATLAPSWAKRRTVARPMPVEPPVTRAILFSSRNAISFSGASRCLALDRTCRKPLHQVLLEKDKQDRDRDCHQHRGRHYVRPVEVKLSHERLDNPRRQGAHGWISR